MRRAPVLASVLLLALVVPGDVRAEIPPPDFCVIAGAQPPSYAYVYRRGAGETCDDCAEGGDCELCAYVGEDDLHVSRSCLIP